MQKREVHTRGVVLARFAAGDGSARVVVYTESLGLIPALAKSAREERSKLRAHLVAGTRGTYSFVRGADSWRVVGAVGARNSYFECTDSAQQRSYARILSVLRQFVRGEGADRDLFLSVWEYLEALPNLAGEALVIAEYVAVLRILAALGYVAKPEAQEFMAPEYSAALIARAAARRGEIIRMINEGMSASGI